MKLNKSKKSKKIKGTRYCGHAAKKHKGKGNRGGKGMAGTGKRADQRKTFIHRYFKNYFGKRGMTSRKKIQTRISTINLRDINIQLEKKPVKEIKFENKKVIGNVNMKDKVSITAYEFSKKAKESIEKAGGKCIILKKEDVKKEN